MSDVIQYNGQDKWKQKATELLNQGGGGGGLVDDVMVNGVSVVDSDKVAQIDLTPYAESADLATVATSGDYDDLENKPTIPAAQVQSDWLEADTSAKSYILNKPTIPPTLSASGNIEIGNNVIKRKEVWLNSVAEYETLQNPDPNTDYHVPSVTFGLLPITVVNGKICCHYTKEV